MIRLSGRITPRVIASRTSAALLPENSPASRARFSAVCWGKRARPPLTAAARRDAADREPEELERDFDVERELADERELRDDDEDDRRAVDFDDERRDEPPPDDDVFRDAPPRLDSELDSAIAVPPPARVRNCPNYPTLHRSVP
jgi:hypothetical protein